MGDHPDIVCAMNTGYAPWELPHHVGRCAYCGEAVERGETFYEMDGKMLHEECFLEYVLAHYGLDKLADELGYEKGTAE